ncbi:unnamed protein product, partial [Timema podura]|nr:unnamed protein product [Timema podura]
NKFGKFLGLCNEVESNLSKCLKIEMEESRRANHEKALERQAIGASSVDTRTLPSLEAVTHVAHWLAKVQSTASAGALCPPRFKILVRLLGDN